VGEKNVLAQEETQKGEKDIPSTKETRGNSRERLQRKKKMHCTLTKRTDINDPFRRKSEAVKGTCRDGDEGITDSTERGKLGVRFGKLHLEKGIDRPEQRDRLRSEKKGEGSFFFL